MLRVALTKGRIEKSAVEMIRKCGYDLSDYDSKNRRLIVTAGNLELVLAKAADVITYIERGVCDVGIVGRDTILESEGEFYELLDLGFGKCRFALAGIKGKNFYNGYTHKVVATKYPNVAKRYFMTKGIDAEIVKIEGSVELAPLLGMADAIVDIVETGATLVENGLEVYEDISYISARCIANVASMKLKNSEITEFVSKLRTQLED
ncbi:MAG: ATP phosphoribosyltransferase [Eubacteriales bacterium]|nr:ATP phosphoribosyltransferase [Eubacteriales bacterium]MDD4474582.1 ATP phosphoribosyltransferase [Eubacteriales bacterium]